MGFFYISYLDEDIACIGICYHNKKKCYEEDQCADHEKGYPLDVIAGKYVKVQKHFPKLYM